ncbi:hypothetical protein [Nocardia sp. X0981]
MDREPAVAIAHLVRGILDIPGVFTLSGISRACSAPLTRAAPSDEWVTTYTGRPVGLPDTTVTYRATNHPDHTASGLVILTPEPVTAVTERDMMNALPLRNPSVRLDYHGGSGITYEQRFGARNAFLRFERVQGRLVSVTVHDGVDTTE